MEEKEILEQKKKDVFEGHPPEVRIRTKKMVVYLFMFAVVMLFGGLTSGYIVKKSGEFWMHVDSPTMLNISLIFLALSSLTMVLSLRTMKKGNRGLSGLMLILTFAMGIGFTLTQYVGWKELSSKGMGFSAEYVDDTGIAQSIRWNNYSEINATYGEEYYFHRNGERVIKDGNDFFMESDELFANPVNDELRFYTNNASAFIVVLIVVHIIHLLFGLIYLLVNYVRIQKNIIHPGDTIRLRVNGIYWHFMGILWIYLFVFLFIIH